MTVRLLTDLEIKELRSELRNGTEIRPEQVEALMLTTEAALAEVAHSETEEIRYLVEVQRLNNLVTQLVEYIETIAEAAGDAPGATSSAEEIKRRAVDMIIRSVQAMKEDGAA